MGTVNYTQSKDYLLNERKLSQETLDEFNVAFCDSSGYLYSNTTYPQDFTKLSNQFFNCLVFPIYDMYGKDIAVMARRMHSSPNKYVNSANSNVFTKGRHLYGLHKSYPHILKQNQVLVVEGLFDMLQLYQCGIKNVVSSMGVALTPHHLALLSRFTTNVVLILDPDQAGHKAAIKHQLFLQKYVSCRSVTIPEELDPDEYIVKVGPQNFKQLYTQDTYHG